MKIAWFHGNLLHTHSGGTRFVVDYTGGLRERFGHEVTVYCDCASDVIRNQLTERGVRLVTMDRFSTNHPLYWLSLPLRLRRKKKRFLREPAQWDCVVSSLFPMNLLTAGLPVRTVQMCYEPFAFFYDPGFLRNFTLPQRLFFRLMKQLYHRQDLRAVRAMDEILTVNETNLAKIERVYGRQAVPVYAGIDSQRFQRAPDAEIAAFRARHPGAPLLFHSTDLTGIKGTYPLLELLPSLLPDFPKLKLLLTVYLDLPAGTATLLRRIRELKLEDHVQYLGCLPSQELPLVYSSVDFVCQPSLNQPANWPLKEAQLCGTPIIGGAESEEVHENNGARIDLRNPEQAGRRLRDLFARDRRTFVIDRQGLIDRFGIEACLRAFERTLHP